MTVALVDSYIIKNEITMLGFLEVEMEIDYWQLGFLPGPP